MLRFLTHLILLLVLGVLAPGEAAAFAPVRVWPPAASAEKLASWGDHPETLVLRQAAAMQAAETQQAASSLGYDFASGRLLAPETTQPHCKQCFTMPGSESGSGGKDIYSFVGTNNFLSLFTFDSPYAVDVTVPGP